VVSTIGSCRFLYGHRAAAEPVCFTALS